MDDLEHTLAILEKDTGKGTAYMCLEHIGGNLCYMQCNAHIEGGYFLEFHNNGDHHWRPNAAGGHNVPFETVAAMFKLYLTGDDKSWNDPRMWIRGCPGDPDDVKVPCVAETRMASTPATTPVTKDDSVPVAGTTS